jgi:hypothetical protein
MNNIFSLNEIVVDYHNTSNLKYCLKDNKLFKCIGGCKDFKKRQFIPKKVVLVEYVNLTSSKELKELAKNLKLPVLHSRKIKKIKGDLK